MHIINHCRWRRCSQVVLISEFRDNSVSCLLVPECSASLFLDIGNNQPVLLPPNVSGALRVCNITCAGRGAWACNDLTHPITWASVQPEFYPSFILAPLPRCHYSKMECNEAQIELCYQIFNQITTSYMPLILDVVTFLWRWREESFATWR